MASTSTLQIVIDARDNASKVIAGVSASVTKATSKFSVEGKILSSIAGGARKSLNFMAYGLVGVSTMAIKAASEMETMKTALVTAMDGSQQAADEAFTIINKFAAKTPYELGEVMRGFIKLKNMGLDPSERALMSYGDTASSMGKSLNDMVEAVADAATGEFERLKEFGVRASQQGDKVTLTFKGISTTVGKNAKEIEEYLIGLGEKNFFGGMEKQSRTLAGQMSTLKDTISNALANIASNSGVLDILKNSVGQLTGYIEANSD